MAADASWAGTAMRKVVPWIDTVGVEFGEITAERAETRLPDNPAHHNHVAGPHAAMIFGLGETASGVLALAAFGAALERATPLVVRAEIGYSRLARGPLTAVATLGRPAAEVLAELDAGTRPEFAVEVTVTDAQGRETAAMTVLWTLRPHR